MVSDFKSILEISTRGYLINIKLSLNKETERIELVAGGNFMEFTLENSTEFLYKFEELVELLFNLRHPKSEEPFPDHLTACSILSKLERESKQRLLERMSGKD